MGGYSLAYTYIAPYLLTVTHMDESTLNAALLAFGIASLIGSKLGGYSADRWGVYRTLLAGMTLHIVPMFLLAVATHSPAFVFAWLILWSFAAWSSGPTQQYHLVTLAPESSGIMLSLNSSVMQLSMAAGAGIGGIVVNGIALDSVAWIGALGVVIALALVFRFYRPSSEGSPAEAREARQA